MLKKIKNNVSVIFICALGLILALANYTPGTFLSGWDTLHPEFNFGLGLQREISGVFRNEQGLGAVAAHSHMADLPHLAILYLLDFVFPTDALRYLYIFSNLIIGPIGIYFFLRKYVVKNKTGAFLGAVFYLLNLGALQIFTVPFEMFTTQYAYLPWIFLFATNYIYSTRQNLKQALLFFSIAILLAAPSAYAATLWYVFFFVFVLYLFSLVVLDYSSSAVKKSLILISLILAINSFWILPNIYFILNHGKDVADALINQLFSNQAFLYNQEFGNVKDVALIKNFLFDWNVYSGNNNFNQLLSPWIAHFNNQFTRIIGYSFALIALIGIFRGIVKKNKVLASLILPLLASFFFLFNDNPPTGFIYNFLQEKILFFREAFRFPGDKILGIFTFIFTIYFAKGQEIILKKLKKLQFVYLLICLFVIFFYMWPAFKGNFINPYMRVKIPSQYFEMFDWFKTQPQNARTAELPVNSFWGWKYYNWHQDKQPSFQGADFLQFGIKQPLLDRDFDRWSPYNEQYYREMSYSIYTKNPELFKSVLQKYNIEYVLLDTSIISPKDDPETLFYPEIKNLLDQNDILQKVKTFGNFLSVYKVKLRNQSNILNNPLSISSKLQAYHEDFIYRNYGNYINREKGLSYPLSNLINNQNKIDPKLIELSQEGFKFNIPIDKPLNFPLFTDTESYINSQLLIQKNNDKLNINIYPILPFKTSSETNLISVNFNTLPGDIAISINRKNIFAFNPKDNAPLFAGNISLNTVKTNTVSAYSLASKKTVFSEITKLNYSLSYCNNAKAQEIFGIEKGINKDAFYIFGKNDPVCMLIPLEQFIKYIPSDEALFRLSFNSKSHISPELCLAQNNTCASSFLNHNKSNYIIVDKSSIDKLTIKLSVNTISKDQVDMVMFENFSLEIFNPVFSKNIPQDNLKIAINTMRENGLQNSLTVPFSGEKLLGTTTIFSDTTNPSLNILTNKQILKDSDGDYLRYTAKNYSLPDHFIYHNLPQDRAYLIAVTSRNVSGLPLSLCATNQITRHCDIYTLLSPFKNFSKDIFLLPAQLKDESGFDLNINNLGIGNNPSINDLRSIEIIPFPYRYLSQISAGDVQKVNKNVFVLPKSYDPDWKAYGVKDSSWLNSAFPFLFGKELKEHVLVNNWANGWILNGQNPKGQRPIIIFWPQYLEYLGLGILIITFIWLLISLRKSKQSLSS